MVKADPGPAPWDLPPKQAAAPRSGRRGPSKVKPLPLAARRAIAEKAAAASKELALVECPGCGFWVLHGRPEGWGATTLDIWCVPYDDAVIIDSYHIGLLWREHYPGRFSTWAPWDRCEALLPHRCGNKWWLYRPTIYRKAVDARHRN